MRVHVSLVAQHPYEYFFPMNDPETVLLIDAWENQEAIDVHHASPMMKTIIELREKHIVNQVLV